MGTTTLTFKNVVSILKFDVGADTLINVSSSSANIAGEFKVTYGETLSIESGTNQAKSIMVSASSERDTYIAVASDIAFSTLEFTAIKTATNWAYKKSSSSAKTAVNTIYPIGKVSDWTYVTNGSLWAKFSTSASTKVRFSKGNLYHDGSNFHFEQKQYSSENSRNSSSHISFFYWSKTASVAYAENYSDGSKAENDIFFTNATTTTPNSNFTVDGSTGVWRTLSGGNSDAYEWYYLMATRTVNGGTGKGKSWELATILSDDKYGGANGLIIYPDNYTAQTAATSYTTGEWTAMETAGCVFLLAAGMWNGTVYTPYNTVSAAGTNGFYWASQGIAFDNALRIAFTPSINNCEYNGGASYRAVGHSVRLVSTAQ